MLPPPVRMKTLLLVLAVLSLAIGLTAWIAWSQDLLPSSGAHGENWERWNSAIDLTWKVMEVSFPASIAFGIAYLFVKPRSQRAISWGLSVIGFAIVAVLAIWFIMTHLAIR